MNKKFIEAFWSGTSQIVASKLLDLWQVNYNKSIANIQDYRQARWQQYKTDLILLDTKIILTDDQAGIGNSIVTGLFIQPEYTDQFNPGTNLKTFNGIPQINKILTTTRGYTVTRSTDAKVFLDDQLLAGKTNIAWRYSSTIIAPFNLEEEGVCSNDILVIRIHSSTRYYDINCRVVGVKGNKAGFVWNLDTLTPGAPAAGISVADQIAGAKALNIPLELDIQGNPVYKELSLKINNELTSLAWKRLNYEKELNTVIVQGEEIYLEPIKIVRCTKIAIDPTIKAIPVLQEYIQAPDVYELNSTWYRTDNNKEISYPLVLNENKDYSIISSDGINVRVNTNVLSDIVSVPFGSLDTFRIEPGDWIRLTQGLNTGNYEITQIIDPNTLKISKILNFAEVGANCIITKRVSKSWLTFSNTKRYPNFWAETTFIDNYKVIEDNFGSLVGLSYSDFKKQGIPVSYKTTIAGIVYAVTRGSQIDTIRLGATILLGLPFTTNAGTITFIEKEYKLDPVTGAPTFGQIIITRNSGVEDIYYFPRGRQIKLNGVWVDEDPILSGIAINPATKVEYQVGDEIPVYTALTKGVIVSDYLSNDSWTQLYTNTDIARYHTFYVRANPSLYGVANLSFVADYIKKIKATYLYIRTVGSIATKDIVKITDKLKLKMTVQQFDGIGQGLPPQILSSKRDILYKTDLAGNFYYRLIRGTASTQTLSDTVNTSAGLTTEQGTTKHDSPFVRPGDFVEFYNSPNSDLYTVLSVPSDTSLRLTTNNIVAKESAFSVYRQLKNPILAGTNLTVNSGSFSIQLPTGSVSAGVCPGDYISLYTNTTQGVPYRVVSIASNSVITLDRRLTENGTRSFYIYRAGLMQRDYTEYLITATGGGNRVTITNPNTRLIIIPGWEVNLAGFMYKILDWDPGDYTLYLNKVVAAGNYTSIIHNTGPILGLNTRDGYVRERIQLKIDNGTNVTTTANSAQVQIGGGASFMSMIAPGNLLKIIAGGNVVNCGWGPGIYPIARVVNNTTLELTRALNVTETKAFSILKNY